MRPRVIFYLSLLLLIGGRSWAVPGGSFECGTLAPPAPSSLSPSDPVVEARIIFVGFPDNPTLTLPTWADEMRSKLHDFISAMSRGAQQLDVSILQNPNAPGMAWLAQHPASYYVAPGGLGYGTVNREVMQSIAGNISDPWANVEMVFMVHYQCTVYSDPSTPTNCENTCQWGGTANLGFVPVSGEYSGAGVTQRVYYWPSLNTTFAREAAPWVAAHEYGHKLTLNHTPGSDIIIGHPEEYVNAGRYDVMPSGSGGVVSVGGLASYQGLQLTDPDIHWVPKITITTETEALRISDIRGPNAAVVEVPIPNSTQSFVFVNHQGTTPFDQVYGNTGDVPLPASCWRFPEFKEGGPVAVVA